MGQRNRTRHAILGMLTLEPMTGYSMRAFAEDVMDFFWQENYGAIYPTLRSLRREGLVQREIERTGSGPDRHVHHITDAGREALRSWLAEPPEQQVVRNELLLKLFFGAETSLATMRAHVERYAEDQQKALERLEKATERLDSEAANVPHYGFWKLGAELGLKRLRATLEWAEGAAMALQDGVTGEDASVAGGVEGATR